MHWMRKEQKYFDKEPHETSFEKQEKWWLEEKQDKNEVKKP